MQIGASAISSDRPGHATPTGVFHTILKDKDHHSSIYNNAAMPFFSVSPKDMTVVIAKKSTAPAEVDHPPLLIPVMSAGSPTDAQPLASSESDRWEPEKSPMGPVSMILSGYDKRIIVLRNGVEIGRSRITVQGPQSDAGCRQHTADHG